MLAASCLAETEYVKEWYAKMKEVKGWNLENVDKP